MDEFERFWILLPDQNNVVHSELIGLLKTPNNQAFNLSLECTKFLEHNLQYHPYPTCQLFRFIPLHCAVQLVYKVLFHQTKHLADVAIVNKLLNLLCNCQLSDNLIIKAEQELYPVLLNHINQHDSDRVKFLLCTIALLNQPNHVLKQFLRFFKKNIVDGSLTKTSIFLQATEYHEHWLNTLNEKEHSIIVDRNKCDIVEIFIGEQIVNINKVKSDPQKVVQQLTKIDLNRFRGGSANRLVITEYVRLFGIQQALRPFIANIEYNLLAGRYNVISYLLKNVDLSEFDYAAMKQILIDNQMYNEKIVQNQQKVHTMSDDAYEICTELELFEQYSIISNILKAIFLNCHIKNYSEIVENIFSDIKRGVRQIDTFHVYVNTMHILFSILFLRWEHIAYDASAQNSMNLPLEYRSEIDHDLMKVSISKKIERNGFCCSQELVAKILNLLKTSAAHKKHSSQYANADDTIKNRFHKIIDNINDGLWRYTLFEIHEQHQCFFSCLHFSKILQFHKSRNELNRSLSSENEEPKIYDEKMDGKKIEIPTKTKPVSLVRQKPRRKYSSRKSNGDKSVSFSHSTENEQKPNSRGDSQLKEKRCIIGKMLGSADHLVATCLRKGDIETTKNILKSNSLEESPLALELYFSELFNQTKQKLAEIFQKYLREEQSQSSETQFDRIKKVAAIGFEASKIINIISNFATTNTLQQDENSKQLLEKYQSRYPTLRTYFDSQLQGTIVIDFVLSLANSYDISLNIFNMLTKTWNGCFDISDLDTNDNTNILSYFDFFKHVLDYLQLYKVHLQRNLSVKNLFCDECYPLNAIDLENKLKAEQAFCLYQKLDRNDINSMEDLYCCTGGSGYKIDSIYFKQFWLFVNSTQHLLQLKQTRKMKNSILDILNSNPYTIIGEIVFEQLVSPLEIETITSTMNINLVHVLAEYVAPKIQVNRPNRNDYIQFIQMICGNLVSFDATKKGHEDVPVNQKMIKITDHPKVRYYLKSHNRLLAFLIDKIHNGLDNTENTQHYDYGFLQKAANLNEVIDMSSVYNGNRVETALNYDHINLEIIYQNTLFNSDSRYILKIIQCAKDINLRRYGRILDALIDNLICVALNEKTDSFEWKLIEYISNINVRAKCVLDHILQIPSSGIVERLIRSVLLHDETVQLDSSCRNQLSTWLHQINVYAQIAEYFDEATWTKMIDLSQNEPENVLQNLLEQRRFELCLDWTEMHSLNMYINKIDYFLGIFLNAILLEDRLNPKLFAMIENLPMSNVIQFYTKLLNVIENIEILSYLIQFLKYHSDRQNLQKYEISVAIIEELSPVERKLMRNLVNMPLIIIEQYLMNTRFEILSTIFTKIEPLLVKTKCESCRRRMETVFEETNETYECFEIHDYSNGAHCITRQCIDSLLRAYAAKALDFRITETSASTDFLTQSMELASLDSLCGAFVMPKEPLERSKWTRDDEAVHCMSCRRARFSMLTRRHHCRQCGRVVCHACSTKRMQVPSLYSDILVRVCNDCFKQTELLKLKQLQSKVDSPQTPDSPFFRRSSEELPEWHFTGNIKHDAMLREEFSFEYAPSVSLCLSILAYHSTSSQDYSNFLLFHCRKLEQLLRPIQPGIPNPEIDYVLITRMLNCLALAAKVSGNLPECDNIRDHAEIVRSVVKHGCESLLPMEPQNSSHFRELCDSLVIEELWSLALEVSLKCGFAKNGVMAAWGISSLKAGCFDRAREKFNHCFERRLNNIEQQQILSLVSFNNSVDFTELEGFPKIRRQPKSSPLLGEILTILETSRHPTQRDVLTRANIIKDSNASLASKQSRKRGNIPVNEPALNILHSLSNLKQIAQGNYENTKKVHKVTGTKAADRNIRQTSILPNERFYDESIYYLINFGSHIDIIQFLLKHNQLETALKYTVFQNVENECFVQAIFMPYLRNGNVETVINVMRRLDETLMVWKKYISFTCRHLEMKSLLHSLYNLQVLLNDPVRASMTCVRFYSMNCTTFQDLQNNSFHLITAQKHLQGELEICQWEEIKVNSSKRSSSSADNSLAMKMCPRALNNHINTIWRQLEVTKFLAKCERDGRETVSVIPRFCSSADPIPTLFGSPQEQGQLVVLSLVCGKNVVEGFGLAFRIIQDFNLNLSKTFGGAAKYLANYNRLDSVEKLIDCIKTNNGCDPLFCDELISLSISTATESPGGVDAANNTEMRAHLLNLIKMISDIGVKINCYIMGGQLKAAYLLAVQNNRLNDVKRVWRQADQTNQSYIKKLCEKKLQIK